MATQAMAACIFCGKQVPHGVHPCMESGNCVANHWSEPALRRIIREEIEHARTPPSQASEAGTQDRQ